MSGSGANKPSAVGALETAPSSAALGPSAGGKVRSLLTAGGVQPCQPWPHLLVQGPWREQLAELAGGRPITLVAEARFADALGSEAIVVPGGEAGKTTEALAALVQTMVEGGLRRDGLVVAIGGGATTDLVGLAAALALRGLPWVAVPTTLLAAVDASLGGKTAVNLPAGKNLYGVFHQPDAVILDERFWTTLSPRQRRSAAAEVFKTALLRPSLLAAWGQHGLEGLEALVWPTAATKLDVVAADAREGGLRQVLNLGHTLGHAVETYAHGQLTHGEAVAIGLAAVLRLAHPRADDLIAELDRAGLPTAIDAAWDRKALRTLMGRDKKSRRDGLAVVVPQADGACELWSGLDPDELLRA